MHDRAAKTYNKEASDFVFRANNSRCAPDEIDLHGLCLLREIELIPIGTLKRLQPHSRFGLQLASNDVRITFMCTNQLKI